MAIHLPFGSDGGGASSIIDLIDQEFADRAARDAFFAVDENRATLVQGETLILVLDNGSGNAVVEIWVGPSSPASYVNTDWADITSAIPSASVIQTLYESNTDTERLRTSKLTILGLLTLSNSILRSSSPLAVGDTIYWGSPEADLTMRARRQASDGHLIYERRELGVWNEKFRVSDSLTVDTAHFITSDGPPVVPPGDLCLYNLRILDSTGTEILRPLFTDGAETFPAVGSLPDGRVRVIQNLAAILADPTTVNAAYKFVAFDEDLAVVAKSGRYNDLVDRPTLPTPRTDEEIRDVTGAALVAGMNVTIVVDDTSDTITISSTGGSGGGTPPPANADTILYGLSPTNNPATVGTATLTTEVAPTNPDTIATGVATQGDFFILLVPQADDVTSIFDTVLNQDVTSIFTETDNVRIISTVAFKSYVIGPLNAGVNETYVINF